MKLDLQQIINNPFAVRLAFFLGKGIPPRIGYPLCNAIGNWSATRHNSKVTQAVRVNQWVARGANLDKETLDQAVRETLQNNVRDLYNLYHYVQKPEATQRLIHLNPLACELVDRPEYDKRGLVIVGLHLSGFDLILQSICRQGFKGMILTLPDPQGGRWVEYEMRKKTGMNLIPTSVSTLRQAVRHIKKGGMVLTGIDRPIPGSKYRPRFFERPAPLPIDYIYLASKAHVPVVIMAAIQQTDGKYRVLSSEPIEMESDSDRERGILHNAENVLKQAEIFIRLAPQQWNVPLPLWPDLLENVPV
jgi:lauroyl/myristoyl acyltransferase